jgi:hypothetical protein
VEGIWNVRFTPDLNAYAKVSTLAALKNPTNPDSTAESSASSVADPSLGPSVITGDMITPGPSNTWGESNYEVFDPLNWMLDGLVDLPSYGLSGASERDT